MALNDNALTDVKKVQTRPGFSSVDVYRIEDSINAFSSLIQRYLGRQLLPVETDVTKHFRYDGSGVLQLRAYSPPTELAELTSITMYSDLPAQYQFVLSPGTSAFEADYRLEPRDGTEEGTYTWLVLPAANLDLAVSGTPTPIVHRVREAEIKIVGNWGAGVVPADVELACIREVTNDLRNPEGHASRSMGEFSFVEPVDGGSWPLSKKTRALLDYHRAPVIG